ncbi:peptide chain release factor N(5)-glutamine methyltransferase [Bradyrhizobium prioriisuperbiae]|uniref:peptide chain release factor N(5)-glutamine methyltransferase n=1 Tax=Bradyrhizobium prioriisuperbiae TaxID=2854389 RepID=UPI0028E7CEB9|nr:peptide chain release factor N(5)-glutamine methyltransferase [Bradyrhizobium prioritasuperba]
MSGGFKGLSVDAARRHLASLLKQTSTDSPELDARLLIGAVLDLDLTGLATSASRIIDEQEAGRLADVARRRGAGEPVARIIGFKEFWGLPLRLSTTTLVPRPDTETVVEAALEIANTGEADAIARIADIGTGTGAILLALLSELPTASGVGTDIDMAALETAADNARQLGLANRTTFIHCSYAQALQGPFDLIVSNPPYIPSREIAGLAIEVRDHDPHRALDGGADGLDAYRALIPQAALLLRTGGALLLEVGQHQDQDVGALMQAQGLRLAATKADLAGIPRVVIGQKWGPAGSFWQ